MKNLSLVLLAVFVISSLSSCGSSPYKKRKACKGNGSWSGNRNLGAIDHMKKDNQKTNTYVWKSEETTAKSM